MLLHPLLTFGVIAWQESFTLVRPFDNIFSHFPHYSLPSYDQTGHVEVVYIPVGTHYNYDLMK